MSAGYQPSGVVLVGTSCSSRLSLCWREKGRQKVCMHDISFAICIASWIRLKEEEEPGFDYHSACSLALKYYYHCQLSCRFGLPDLI